MACLLKSKPGLNVDHSTPPSGKRTDIRRLHHVLRVAAQWRMKCQGVFFCCCVPTLTLAIKREKPVCVADEITPGLAKSFVCDILRM